MHYWMVIWMNETLAKRLGVIRQDYDNEKRHYAKKRLMLDIKACMISIIGVFVILLIGIFIGTDTIGMIMMVTGLTFNIALGSVIIGSKMREGYEKKYWDWWF